MKVLFLCMAFSAAALAEPSPGVQQIHLAPGEYRWVPLTVKQTPTEIACRLEVSAGSPTVHAELLRMNEFRLFVRGQRHDALATSREGQNVEFRRIVDFRGQYAVVVRNRRDGAPVDLTFDVRTEVDPSSGAVAQTLPAGRKLAVILVSFALFFVTVAWTGVKLTRAIRD